VQLVTLDLDDPVLLSDPHATFRRWREEAPVFRARLGAQSAWVLSRYDDVKDVLEDPASLMRPPGAGTPRALGDGAAVKMWKSAMSMMDPPEHTQVRRLVGRAFTRRRAEQMRPQIEALVEEIFQRLDGRTEFEVVADLALRVPMRVICGVLGIPDSDWNMLQAWTPDFLRIFLPDAASPDDRARLDRASQNFMDYFGAMVDARLAAPRDDLTTELAALHANGGLTRDQVVGALRGLLTAGFETSAATITAGCLCLAERPDQLDLLRARPDCVPAAVEEVLRWETPVRAHMRYLGSARVLHGVELEAGAAVWLLLGSANRDPRRFPEPDVVDVSRGDAAHLSFGGGRHFCLGAYVARVELQAVFSRIVQRYRTIERVTGRPQRRPNFQFPSIERLVVRVR
jgi:cytochrome P450